MKRRPMCIHTVHSQISCRKFMKFHQIEFAQCTHKLISLCRLYFLQHIDISQRKNYSILLCCRRCNERLCLPDKMSVLCVAPTLARVAFEPKRISSRFSFSLSRSLRLFFFCSFANVKNTIWSHSGNDDVDKTLKCNRILNLCNQPTVQQNTSFEVWTETNGKSRLCKESEKKVILKMTQSI